MKRMKSLYNKISVTTLLILTQSFALAQSFEGAEGLRTLIVAILGLAAAVACLKIAGDIISHASAASEGDPAAKKRIINSFIMIVIVLSAASLISFIILKAKDAGLQGYEDVIPEK